MLDSDLMSKRLDNYNPDTLLKLHKLYLAQYGIVPEMLYPAWYLIKPNIVRLKDKSLKARLLKKVLLNQSNVPPCYITDSEDLIVFSHYCKMEVLAKHYGPLDFTPIMGDLNYLPIKEFKNER